MWQRCVVFWAWPRRAVATLRPCFYRLSCSICHSLLLRTSPQLRFFNLKWLYFSPSAPPLRLFSSLAGFILVFAALLFIFCSFWCQSVRQEHCFYWSEILPVCLHGLIWVVCVCALLAVNSAKKKKDQNKQWINPTNNYGAFCQTLIRLLPLCRGAPSLSNKLLKTQWASEADMMLWTHTHISVPRCGRLQNVTTWLNWGIKTSWVCFGWMKNIHPINSSTFQKVVMGFSTRCAHEINPVDLREVPSAASLNCKPASSHADRFRWKHF